MLGFKDLYFKELMPVLKEKLELTNVMQVPKVCKVILNMGVGDAIADSKHIENAVAEMTLISGQKPVITRAKKSIASFKLREGMPLGCKVSLRGGIMYAFLEKLVMVALPRLRDFRGFSIKNFDGNGNLNIGIKEHMVFPEIDYDKITKVRGLNISIITSVNNDKHAKALLEELKFPFN